MMMKLRGLIFETFEYSFLMFPQQDGHDLSKAELLKREEAYLLNSFDPRAKKRQNSVDRWSDKFKLSLLLFVNSGSFKHHNPGFLI